MYFKFYVIITSLRRSSDIKMTLTAENQSNLNMGTVYIRKPTSQLSANSTEDTTTTPSPPVQQLHSAVNAAVSKAVVGSQSGIRKRNVNFNSIHLEATKTKSQDAAVPRMAAANQFGLLAERDVAPDVIGEAVGRRLLMAGDDDGFESLNGKSSSGEENIGAQPQNADEVSSPKVPARDVSQISMHFNNELQSIFVAYL